MPVATTSNSVAATSANATASISISAATGKRIDLRQVIWSYSVAPPSGNLIISAGSSAIFNVDIGASGPQSMVFYGMQGNTGSAMTLTLASGTDGIGKLNAYWIQK